MCVCVDYICVLLCVVVYLIVNVCVCVCVCVYVCVMIHARILLINVSVYFKRWRKSRAGWEFGLINFFYCV